MSSPNASAAQRPEEDFSTFDKEDLHHLADRLSLGESAVLATCIAFIEAETKGVWHGHARALMCRRLKHCSLCQSQRTRLVSCITERLHSGRFAEQFRDQLRLAVHLDAERVLAVARSCVHDPRDHVRRYVEWLLARLPNAKGNAEPILRREQALKRLVSRRVFLSGSRARTMRAGLSGQAGLLSGLLSNLDCAG